jgi:hypothetical protein
MKVSIGAESNQESKGFVDICYLPSIIPLGNHSFNTSSS